MRNRTESAAKALTERWEFSDYPICVVTVPLVCAVGLTAISLILQNAGWVKVAYASPYVALVAVISNRLCIRAGLLTTALSIAAYEIFVSPSDGGLAWPSVGEMSAYVSMLVAAVLVAPRSPKPEKVVKLPGRTESLPFTSKKHGGSDGLHGNGNLYWDVSPSGDWGVDCRVGSEYARIYMQHDCVRKPVICWVIRDMIMKGRFTGVEAGFLQTLAGGRRRYAVGKEWQRRRSAA